MSITGISCRKGISSILGTLIFVSIIFTSFIPMMLVMRQADTMYDMRKHEMEILDQERIDEEVYVYVFPVTEYATTLTLDIQNRGNLVIDVVQVWINDVPIALSEQISSMNSIQLILDDDPYGFTPVEDTIYLIKIKTARGNVFSSDSGSLYYNVDGIWEGGIFAINFLISYPQAGWYEIEIREGTEIGALLSGTPFQTHKSSSGPAFAFFQVPIAATYYVKITKNSAVIKETSVIIGWPNGSPVEWVFA